MWKLCRQAEGITEIKRLRRNLKLTNEDIKSIRVGSKEKVTKRI